MALVARPTTLRGVHFPALLRPRSSAPRSGGRAARCSRRAKGLDDDLANNPTLLLLRHYDALCNPSGAGVTASQALKDLVDTCLDLFALGFDEDGLLAEAQRLRPGDGTSQESGAGLADCLALVFITLSSLPAATVTRWSSAAPVSERSLARWRGFCLMIVNAYFTSGMAWFSVAKLQVEQSLSLGAAEPAPVVSERMMLVYQVRCLWAGWLAGQCISLIAHALTPAPCVLAADVEHRRAAVSIPLRLAGIRCRCPVAYLLAHLWWATLRRCTLYALEPCHDLYFVN